MRADGSDVQNLTRSPEMEGAPQWSPDGRWILFTSNLAGNADLHRMRANGTDPQRLTTSADNEISYRWSPDGRWIAVSGYHNHSLEIYRLQADGSNLQRLTTTSLGPTYSGYFDPQWLPPLTRSWHPWRIGAAGIMLLLMEIIPWLRILRKVPS
jgi:TolB protein